MPTEWMPALWVAAAVLAVLLAALLLPGRRARRRRRGGGLRPRGVPAGIPIRYTRHARERMDQRGIWSGEVDGVVRAPARVARDAEEHSVRLEGDFPGRVLKVWVAEPWPPQDEVVVKSTAWNHVLVIRIPRASIGRVIGKGGATVSAIRRETGAQIAIDSDGTVRIHGDSEGIVQHAARRVETTAIAPR